MTSMRLARVLARAGQSLIKVQHNFAVKKGISCRFGDCSGMYFMRFGLFFEGVPGRQVKVDAALRQTASLMLGAGGG
ncbi:hypothetical protein [Roseobacter sinensis]|uniref:Uncharacterized protein n=1 Tax=Roseobacter sinensis TaxID=2931391 RepID=A0ABT3BE99_9RHOB|nr:hypothetical protein [Roseobacter sp. WL0113]MCV3271877.1 hypothetical protein [Roseobacter sp. WL0113]